ncbi:MAG: hypothetical protein JRF70_02695 [Deltaproteobacteria bacterium]|nr:hypothetical protein [Deltaproteobacteria bacterium]
MKRQRRALPVAMLAALLARRGAPAGDPGASARTPTALDPELEAIVDWELRNEAP